MILVDANIALYAYDSASTRLATVAPTELHPELLQRMAHMARLW